MGFIAFRIIPLGGASKRRTTSTANTFLCAKSSTPLNGSRPRARASRSNPNHKNQSIQIKSKFTIPKMWSPLIRESTLDSCTWCYFCALSHLVTGSVALVHSVCVALCATRLETLRVNGEFALDVNGLCALRILVETRNRAALELRLALC